MVDIDTWDAGRLQLTFATSPDAPVSLIAVQVDGRAIAFAAGVAGPPVVELFLATDGHARSGQRRVDSAVGLRMRYLSHLEGQSGPVSTLTITQVDPRTGLQAVLRLFAHREVAVLRADVEVVNEGSAELDLTGVSSIVLPRWNGGHDAPR